MAGFSQTVTQGFEHLRQTVARELFYLPGDPGVTYTRGDRCILDTAGTGGTPTAGSAGTLILATDSLANAVFTVAKTTACPAATQGFPVANSFDPVVDSAENRTLVPVLVDVPADVPVFLATIEGYNDDLTVSYTASTRAIATTTGFGADDRPNGALLYVHDGTGAGQWNIVEDYDHADGAAELLVICHRDFATALDSTSDILVLSGEAAANRGVAPFGRVDIFDEDEIHVADGVNDGDYVFFGDIRDIPRYIALGQMPVINAAALYA